MDHVLNRFSPFHEQFEPMVDMEFLQSNVLEECLCVYASFGTFYAFFHCNVDNNLFCNCRSCSFIVLLSENVIWMVKSMLGEIRDIPTNYSCTPYWVITFLATKFLFIFERLSYTKNILKNSVLNVLLKKTFALCFFFVFVLIYS